MKHKLSGEKNFEKEKIVNEKIDKKKKEQKLSGENTPMSKKGKFSVQNWQSDPMNSPKAFGELKILIVIKLTLSI